MPKPADVQQESKAELRNTLDSDNNRLVNTIRGEASPAAMKAARTRWENTHRDYWRSCRAAWKEYEDGQSGKGKKQTLQQVADKYGVTVTDIAEIAGTPDPEEEA